MKPIQNKYVENKFDLHLVINLDDVEKFIMKSGNDPQK